MFPQSIHLLQFNAELLHTESLKVYEGHTYDMSIRLTLTVLE